MPSSQQLLAPSRFSGLVTLGFFRNLNMAMVKCALIWLVMLLSGAASMDCVGFGGFDPPDKGGGGNPPEKGGVPNIVLDDEFMDEEDVLDYINDLTPGIRLCDRKGGCGKLTYLRKGSCANPKCRLFYMAKTNQSWTTRRGPKESHNSLQLGILKFYLLKLWF